MEYLTLNNGVNMPVLGFGTFMLSGETCINPVVNAIWAGYRMKICRQIILNSKKHTAGTYQRKYQYL